MASLGHVAVGMAAARLYHHASPPRWSSLASWSALSLLPDVDVIGFAFGVDYGDPWGHRGATHSIAFSVGLALAIGIAARRFKRPFVRTFLFASAVLASHAILDTMTDGGLGCALWWPIDLARYFAPWRPIPVAPIGPDFFSREGGVVALTELVLFAPLLLYALRFSRRPAKPIPLGLFFSAWLGSVWLISSGGQARESVVGFLLGEDTAYTSGFSEQAFRTIQHGHSDADVRRLLGAPLRESWLYPATGENMQPSIDQSASSIRGVCGVVNFEAGVVATTVDRDACRQRGIQPGMSFRGVEERLGAPPERDWHYTWSPSGRHHRVRIVCFTKNSVSMLIRQWN